MKYKNRTNRKNNIYNLQAIQKHKDYITQKLERDFYLLSKTDIDKNAMYVHPVYEKDYLFIQQNDDSLSNNCMMSCDDIYFQKGYASATIILLKIIRLSTNNLIRRSYINPAMFCFRQYLELSIKDSLLRFRDFRTKAKPGEPSLKQHDIKKLWDDLKQYIQYEDVEIENITRLINEFVDVDKDATMFRYNASLNKALFYQDVRKPLIDIDDIIIRFLQLYRYLEGINELSRLKGDDYT